MAEGSRMMPPDKSLLPNLLRRIGDPVSERTERLEMHAASATPAEPHCEFERRLEIVR
jgi:hypothetical protein